MSDFIREVDEGLRHDQFRRFLERYWIALAALVILVLAGVGAWEGYDYVRTERAQSSGGRYLDALDLLRDNKAAEGDAALRAVVADGTAGYKLLARFRLPGPRATKTRRQVRPSSTHSPPTPPSIPPSRTSLSSGPPCCCWTPPVIPTSSTVWSR